MGDIFKIKKLKKKKNGTIFYLSKHNNHTIKNGKKH